MLNLIAQILVGVLVALMAGVLLGWLFWARGARKRLAELERSSESELSGLRDELADRERQLDEAEVSFLDLQIERNALAEEIGDLRASLGGRDGEIARLKGELDGATGHVSSLTEASKARESLLQSFSARVATLERIEGQLTEIRQKLAEREADLKKLCGEVDALERTASKVEAAETRVRSLEDAVKTRGQRVAELERLLADRDKQVAEAEPEARANPEPPPTTAPPTRTDDLKRIRGIGPVLERLLNQMGITTFRRIAGWSDEEIDRVQAQLEEFPGRIRRDHWVEGAKQEHLKVYKERI